MPDSPINLDHTTSTPRQQELSEFRDRVVRRGGEVVDEPHRDRYTEFADSDGHRRPRNLCTCGAVAEVIVMRARVCAVCDAATRFPRYA